jgi:hypothetical protein
LIFIKLIFGNLIKLILKLEVQNWEKILNCMCDLNNVYDPKNDVKLLKKKGELPNKNSKLSKM